MRTAFLFIAGGVGLALGCSDQSNSIAGAEAKVAFPSPAALTTINVGTGTAWIWAYVSDNLATPQDPVNLVFTGMADPRSIRNALLGLDGDRSPVFPPVFPFTCTWSDAIGGLMEGFDEATGWSGGAVQLQCGSYGPIRFHLRLFKMGSFTVGNGHFELVIPGTADHQVLSWELAEQLVAFDLGRSGLLGAAPAPTGAINAAPFYRMIPAVIYNGMPVELRALIGGPLGDVANDVGIPTDGAATVLALAGEAPPVPGSPQEIVIQYDQVIPKPFCNSPGDFLYVSGPVTLRQEVSVVHGELRQIFRASGELAAVPVDPLTGQPTGFSMRAQVSEYQDARANDHGGSIRGTQLQQLLPASTPGAGQLKIQVNIDPGKQPHYDREVTCH